MVPMSMDISECIGADASHQNPFAFLLRFAVFMATIVLAFVFVPTLRREFRQDLLVSPEISTLIMGDSHLSLVLDGAEISGIRNLAEPGEAYVFTLAKLRACVAENPQIEEVFVGLSYHNICSAYDARKTMPYYINLLTMTDLQSLLSRHPNPVFVMEVGKLMANTLLDDQRYLGGYENEYSQTVVDEQHVQMRIDLSYKEGETLTRISAANIRDLLRIRSFCEERGIDCHFLMTPLHPLYLEKVPLEVKTAFWAMQEKYDLDLWDFSETQPADQDFLPDGDHLNQEGAASFEAAFIQRWQHLASD